MHGICICCIVCVCLSFETEPGIPFSSIATRANGRPVSPFERSLSLPSAMSASHKSKRFVRRRQGLFLKGGSFLFNLVKACSL